MKDFYYILGVNPACSLEDIKAAYRKLSKKLHPDLNQGDAYFESKFRDVKEAFETLRDPLKRRLYDGQLNQFKSARPKEEPQKQQSTNRSYGQSTYSRPSAAKPGKVRRKGPGVGLSLTLIILAIIVGIYLFRSFADSKPKKSLAYLDTETSLTTQPVHKKHKHKHGVKTIVAAKTDKRPFDTAKMVAIKPVVMKPVAVKPKPITQPAIVKPEPLRPMIAKTWPDSNQNHSDYLYTTYVHPNVTGIVPLREYDRFNSSVIASMPANSRVFVLERGSTYYRVFYDNSIGFVPKWSLHKK